MNELETLIEKERWVWIIVLNPGKNEEIFGQYIKDEDISYIPVFIRKSHALDCCEKFHIDKNTEHEIQAIQYKNLLPIARKNGFSIFIVKYNGEIVAKAINKE